MPLYTLIDGEARDQLNDEAALVDGPPRSRNVARAEVSEKPHRARKRSPYPPSRLHALPVFAERETLPRSDQV